MPHGISTSDPPLLKFNRWQSGGIHASKGHSPAIRARSNAASIPRAVTKAKW